jgi:transmembrane sensor
MSSLEHWHARLRDGGLDADERAAFERWCADPANAAALAELERLMAGVDALMATPEMAAEADAALAALRARKPGRLFSVPRLAWLTAATGAVALAAAALVVVPVPSGVLAPQSPDRFRTEVGGLEIVALPDGSRMTLNTASEARLAFDDAERRVVLLQGQALFDVAADPARPFVVAVDGATVTAVGTVFDVRRDEAAFTVTLVEGVVDVAVAPSGGPTPQQVPAPGDGAVASGGLEPRPPGAGAVAPPAAASSVVLQAGEQLVVSRGADAGLERRAADLEAALGWTDGVLIFRRTRLADAVAEVNRYTAEPLRLGDPALADLELSGVFRAGDVDAFAWSLEQTFPIRIDAEGRARVVRAREGGP